MAFLPIVDRELRVAARRSGPFWTRFAMACGASAIGAVILLLFIAAPPEKTSVYIFRGLAGLSLIYALFYGRQATADCISSEKREGTLGLLFLTDLKGHDIIFGKLAATSLSGFYGLLAAFPVLAIPILMGGVTYGEFWRVLLVLVTTFFLSLAIGIFVSVLSKDARRAMGANLLVLTLITAFPPSMAAVLKEWVPSFPFVQDLLMTCPAWTLYAGTDVVYAGSSGRFWLSVWLLNVITAVLLVAASRLITSTWQERSANPNRPKTTPLINWSHGTQAQQFAWRKRLLDANPYYWLATRQLRKPLRVWAFVVAVAIWSVIAFVIAGDYWLNDIGFLFTAFLLNMGLKMWLAIEAAHQLSEDHKGGTMEFLLSTPLTARDIIYGQWLSLRRQFAGPAAVAVAVQLVFMLVVSRRTPGPETFYTWMAIIVILLLDLVALGWASMWYALNARSAHQATLKATVRILIGPTVLVLLIYGFAHVWVSVVLNQPMAELGWQFHVGLWFFVSLAADLIFGLPACLKLLSRFRELALQRELPQSVTVEKPAASSRSPVHRSNASVPLFRRRRVRAFALFCACVAGALAYFALRDTNPPYPPPLRVALGASNQVFRATFRNFSLLILPDGSLWEWQPGMPHPQSATPEGIGPEFDWIKVLANGRNAYGLGADGTLWSWDLYAQGRSNVLRQLGKGNRWIDVAGTYDHTVAIREDGTLWANGGDGPYAQLGTSTNWAAVTGHAWGMFGLHRDGTMWGWGRLQPSSVLNPNPAVYEVREPTRLSAYTNWVSFQCDGPFVNSKEGGTYEIVGLSSGPDSSATAASRLIVQHGGPGRLALACYALDEPHLFHLRPDGSLWSAPYASLVPAEWSPVGKRSDWVAIYGSGYTAIGVTADGGVWTWGYDPSRIKPVSFRTRLRELQNRIARALGARRVQDGKSSDEAVFQRTPRPLMQLIYTNQPAALPPGKL